MNRKLVLALISSALMLFMLYVSPESLEAKASNGYKVHNAVTGLDYASIQEAIDANETLDGHAILVDSGIFHEQVTIRKSLSIIGQSRYSTTIDGNRTSTAVNIIADNVSLREFTVTNGSIGISVNHSSNSFISRNILVDNIDAIVVRYSTDCEISDNIVGNNTNRGILVTNSGDFTVSRNSVYGTGWYGINANTSLHGKIMRNLVYKNSFDGIGLFNSSNCEIAGNDVSDNVAYGILIDFHSSHNSIYHNNIINNGIQAVTSSLNMWNSNNEGNYWSDYAGTDHNSDGIGDTLHTVDSGEDLYPLMGVFRSFNTSLGRTVNVISNSTIEGFEYFDSNSTIRMQATNSSGSQIFGFCRIRIPSGLVNVANISVVIDDGSIPVFKSNYTLDDNDTHRWMYFAYEHSTRRIAIIPEFPTIVLLAPLTAGTFLVLYLRKRNLNQKLEYSLAWTYSHGHA